MIRDIVLVPAQGDHEFCRFWAELSHKLARSGLDLEDVCRALGAERLRGMPLGARSGVTGRRAVGPRVSLGVYGRPTKLLWRPGARLGTAVITAVRSLGQAARHHLGCCPKLAVRCGTCSGVIREH